MVGAPDQLTQVVMNVMGNAIRYTESGGVRVDVRVGSHRVEVSVIDSGRGLLDGDVDRIIERFVRVDDDFADGTGVGLTIASSIVVAHGGSLRASSPGLGAGSTFVVDLPIA